MNRTYSREIAVKLSFEKMVNKETSLEIINKFKEHSDDANESIDYIYIKNILKKIERNYDDIIEKIEKYSNNRKVERISKINFAILLVATCEILYIDEVPYEVSINEAIDIGRNYTDYKSCGFINGVLDSIKLSKEGEKCGTNN